MVLDTVMPCLCWSGVWLPEKNIVEMYVQPSEVLHVV